MTNGIYPSVQAGISGIVNIATVKAVTDTVKKGLGSKKTFPKNRKGYW